MKWFVPWIGALLFLMGCPEEGPVGEQACNLDSECPVGQICETGICVDGSRNGGAQTDAGSPLPDAGPPNDAGAPPDAGVLPDAGSQADAGNQADAGERADSGSDADSGIVSDGGMGMGSDSGSNATEAGPSAGDGGANQDSDSGSAPPDDGGSAGPDAGPPQRTDGGFFVMDGGFPGSDSGVPPDAGLPCMDVDGDLHGENCAAGPDCNESNDQVHANATEICNGIDDNCDGIVDEEDGAPVCPCDVDEMENRVYLLCPAADWSDAFHSCRRFGYELTTIGSDVENTTVTQWVTSELPGQNFWIGASDVAVEANNIASIFKWTDGMFLSFHNFGGSQPDNFSNGAVDFGNQGEDCVEVKLDGAWNDRPCTDSLPFVCEADPDALAATLTPYPSPLFGDDFSTDSAGWPNQTLWFSTRTGGGADAEVISGEVRLDTQDPPGAVQMIAWDMPSVDNSEVRMQFRSQDGFSDTQFSVFLKGSGGGSTSDSDNPDDGYGLIIGPGTQVEIRSSVNDASNVLAGATETILTDAWNLIFQVKDNKVRAKIWMATNSEPSIWTLEATDTAVGAPGKLYLHWESTTGAHRHLFIDDVVVSTP
jgi:hypothetical protein